MTSVLACAKEAENMCVAVAGKVLSVEGETGRVDVRGNVVRVNLGLVPARTGDFVLVHAGCALQVLPPHEALEMEKLFDELLVFLLNSW